MHLGTQLLSMQYGMAFGTALHVSGTNRETIEKAIAPHRHPPFEWQEVEPTLEDVFIHLMRTHSPDMVSQAA